MDEVWKVQAYVVKLALAVMWLNKKQPPLIEKGKIS
jgi:hypothetical protein